MQVTTITYQRILNLGNFNSARLEKIALADEHEDHEVATQTLIENVERQIHQENIHKQLDKEIRDKEETLAALKVEYDVLKSDYQALHKQFETLKAQQTNEDSDSVDDIPFDAGGPTSNDPAHF